MEASDDRFRLFYLLVPVLYALVGAGLVVVYYVTTEQGIGRGEPPAWLLGTLHAMSMPWTLWGLDLMAACFNLCILAGLGYLIDRGIERLLRPR